MLESNFAKVALNILFWLCLTLRPIWPTLLTSNQLWSVQPGKVPSIQGLVGLAAWYKPLLDVPAGYRPSLSRRQWEAYWCSWDIADPEWCAPMCQLSPIDQTWTHLKTDSHIAIYFLGSKPRLRLHSRPRLSSCRSIYLLTRHHE